MNIKMKSNNFDVYDDSGFGITDDDNKGGLIVSLELDDRPVWLQFRYDAEDIGVENPDAIHGVNDGDYEEYRSIVSLLEKGFGIEAELCESIRDDIVSVVSENWLEYYAELVFDYLEGCIENWDYDYEESWDDDDIQIDLISQVATEDYLVNVSDEVIELIGNRIGVLFVELLEEKYKDRKGMDEADVEMIEYLESVNYGFKSSYTDNGYGYEVYKGYCNHKGVDAVDEVMFYNEYYNNGMYRALEVLV